MYRWYTKILRYDALTSTWLRVGDMMGRRAEHTVTAFNVTSYILKNYC